VRLLKSNFYLTGGTALAEFYLQHRCSEDFDFFTATPNVIGRTVARIQQALDKNQVSYKVSRSLETFAEIFAYFGEEVVKVDLALDTPYRLKPTIFNEACKLYIENPLDLACNKLSALFDRAEPKDFVDVYFIDKEMMPLEEIIPFAKQKHIGLEEYWLARAMFQVKHVAFLPKMIKSLGLEELKAFFLKRAEHLLQP